jgi:putative Ca2+/H+ antiporter (TMEM165/GDT1 family)
VAAAEALVAFGTALGVVFLAELGDKTQLLLAAQAARGPARRIVLEAVAAFAVLTALAVLAGAWVASVVPPVAATLASGALFLVFGVLALRKGDEEDGEGGRTGGRGTFVLVLLAELGDKTQVATAALAASSASPLATGLGAWLALSASAVLAAFAGSWLASRMEPRRRARLSAAVFLLVGAATLAYGAWLAFA